MARYDLAGNILPESGSASSPDPAPAPLQHTSVLPANRTTQTVPKTLIYAPAPAAPIAPPAPHAILTRGLAQETPAQRVRAYGGLVGTFLLLIALTYAVAAIPSPRIPAPTSYTPYTSPSAALTCAVPDGWKSQEDDASLSFSLKQARIEVDAPPADAVSASHSASDLHAQTQGMIADALADDHFREQSALPLATGMSDAVISQWSASSGLMHLQGYRATLVSGSNAFVVLCVCPQRDWATLQPVFLHVIQSMTPTNTPPQNGGTQP